VAGTRLTQGGPLSPKVIDHLQDAVKQHAGDGNLGHLENRVAGMRCCRVPGYEQPSRFGGIAGEMDTTSQLQTPGARHYDAPLAVGGENWAILASLINSAKLHELDPWTYLADVLERIVSGQTKVNALSELLPWNWKAAQAERAQAA
jgi:hypothetical protein